MRCSPPEVELILQKTWTGESDFFPWLLLRNWHYLASGWQVCINEWLQVKLAVMSYGVLSYTSLILLKLPHESGPLGMANWMNVDVYEVLPAGKSVTCVSWRSVSGILSCSSSFSLLLCWFLCIKQPTPPILMEWSRVGDGASHSARPGLLVVPGIFVTIQMAFFDLSGSQ